MDTIYRIAQDPLERFNERLRPFIQAKQFLLPTLFTHR